MNAVWSKNEFVAYVLLYVAHCNHIETEEESSYILAKIEESVFNKMHTEIVMDGDDDLKLNKIKEYLSDEHYSETEKKELLQQIKEVIFADGTVDSLERKVYKSLQELLV